jgi:ECL1/2/3 zinc binding proteins
MSSSGSLTRIPSDLHFSKADLDPTEWKPVIHGYDYWGGHGHGHARNASSTSLAASPSPSSDAWTYLSQFHSSASASASASASSLPPLVTMRRPTQPRHASNSSTSLSAMSSGSTTIGGVPSLVHTPATSTSASSVTSSSPPSSAADYVGAYVYDTASRPLPPRHNPSFSGVTKGVELVVPHIIAPGSGKAAAAAVEHVDVVDEDDVDVVAAHEGGIWLRA